MHRSLLLVALAGCFSPMRADFDDGDAGWDAGLPDAGVAALAVTIRNPGAVPRFLSGSLRCGTGFELYRDGARVLIPTAWHCRCDGCSASVCQGIADPSIRWIELAPQAAATFSWRGLTYALGQQCASGSGCWSASAAPAGEYEIRVGYASWASRRDQLCPSGRAPWDAAAMSSGVTALSCEDLSLRCPDVNLDRQVVARFRWPDDAAVTIDLPAP